MPQKYGGLANCEPAAQTEKLCLVCDQKPIYSWTDYSGEAYCVFCGMAYQLKWGSDEQQKEGNYPYLNVREDALPMFRRYWAETGKPSGMGTFLGFHEYPEVARARQAFNQWFKEHEQDYPQFVKKAEASA